MLPGKVVVFSNIVVMVKLNKSLPTLSKVAPGGDRSTMPANTMSSPTVPRKIKLSRRHKDVAVSYACDTGFGRPTDDITRDVSIQCADHDIPRKDCH